MLLHSEPGMLHVSIMGGSCLNSQQVSTDIRCDHIQASVCIIIKATKKSDYEEDFSIYVRLPRANSNRSLEPRHI